MHASAHHGATVAQQSLPNGSIVCKGPDRSPWRSPDLATMADGVDGHDREGRRLVASQP